ncbi:MAG TPA: iron-sulfur cluster repair di-iron protein [Cytophagales bacterium]|nr:iron-sulfur cluster repair di-iron protein [Cytophagales bacterium]
MTVTEENIVGELVAQDYRTASVFEKFGIDFCCKGNRTIHEVCESKNITPNELLEGLNKAVNASDYQSIDYKSWPLDLLADYIEKKHHRYVEEKTPVIRQYLEKICSVHGDHHTELFEIAELFKESIGEFTKHMKKEELVLFPFIRKMVKSGKEQQPVKAPYFGSVKNPVEMMMHEHDAEGDRFRKIAALSNNYNPPADACNTYKVTFALLKEFEDDLHLHIHLENNILFPKSIGLEKSLN